MMDPPAATFAFVREAARSFGTKAARTLSHIGDALCSLHAWCALSHEVVGRVARWRTVYCESATDG